MVPSGNTASDCSQVNHPARTIHHHLHQRNQNRNMEEKASKVEKCEFEKIINSKKKQYNMVGLPARKNIPKVHEKRKIHMKVHNHKR